ncbi:GNAT family N-acetyltransferase [Thiomicrorhabdus chilensis]|uniref:GNAT family N-acetyltransferase n=1 Tax=Thiomicrorhabdus chilensis TaxID=63656 RepID=UPI0003FA4956|nr:N-acetyltransferase [Thiomicrorhabdus chilensis]
MKISRFTPSQIAEIQSLFTSTFSDSEGPAEGESIGQLALEMLNTTDSADLQCFIASEEKRIIASIIFSRLSFAESDIQAFLLAPVAVLTAYQKQGIGQTIIQFGLQQLRKQDVELAVTYGDPGYYSKVGFEPVSTQQVPAPMALSMPQGWLAQSLTGAKIPTISGKSKCVPAIAKPEYW